jgi:hypothetical protein
VWDSLRNIEKWKAMNRLHAPSHVPLGYVPDLSRSECSSENEMEQATKGAFASGC